MRTITRFAAAILAAIGLSAPLVAVPAASWSDFTNLTSGNYTLTADAACTVNANGSITLGGAGLSYTFKSGDGMYANKVTTVVMDVTLPNAAGTLLTLGLATNKIQVNSTGSALTTSHDKGSVRQTGTCAAGRTTIAVTYSGSQGTHVYKDGNLIITDGGLMWSGQNLNKLTIGAYDNGESSLTGTILHSMTIYAAKLSAAEVLSETAAAVKRTAEVSGAANWSDLTWDPSAPTTSSDSAVLQVAGGEHTLTLDNGKAISLSRLFTQGTGSLTFDGSGSMTSSFTSISSDTDVSAITASLGVVTLASNKTLTAKSASDFSSITAGAGSTVKYTAPSGSIAKVDNATVELAAAAETNGITLPSAGGTYKVSSGTYTGMTLARTATATTYAFTGGGMTFSGEFSFGKATATISDGTVRAPKMVTVQGNNDYRTSTVTQTGGEIILSGETDGSTTENAVLMFGHWPNARSTYTLSGGSITAASGGMRFGNDSPSTLNLSGTGLLKVKGIWGKGSTNCALNLSGGTLSIGSDGFKSIDRLTVTATGGELNAFASNTIAQAIALNGPTTFSANADCVMTVQGTLSGSGTLVKSGAGTLSLTGTVSTPVEVAKGTLDLGTQRPTLGGIADGAKVKLTATEAELANNAIPFPTTMTTAPAKERFTVVKPDGTTVTLTAEPTVADGTLTVTLPQTGGLITATGNWSEAGVSGETVVYVRGGESADSAITVTLDASLSTYTQIAVIGHVKFVTTTTQATLPTTIVLESGSVLTATASFSEAYTIPSGATVVLDGTEAISSASALRVNGALKTQGTVTLSGANAVPAGGSLSVETGTLTLTASDQSLAGTINIAADATLVNTTTDALAYGGSPVVNVRGTLDMGSTRWTVGSGNTLNVYAGATILGVGDEHGALDFYNEATHTLNVPNEGDASQPVTISAKLRLRQSNVILKFNIALANAKVYLTGIVRDVGKLEKAGAGSSRLILSGENKTYTGATTVSVGYLDLVGGCTIATSGVTVASGAAVTFQADNASTETTYATPFALTGRMDKEGAHSVILSGAITGAGAVNVKNGGLTLDASAATAEAPTAVANPITVGLDTGTAGTLTAKGFLTLSNSSNTVKATGTLTIASGKTVLTTTGGGNGIKGNLNIASGAMLQCATADAPRYRGAQTFDISGTLEITGSTRWTISSGATITLYEGARLKGSGDTSCAFDFWENGTITANGNATIEATVGNHNNGGTLTINQTAGITTISGEVRNSLGLSVAGSGTVVYAPASSVTATSSPLSVSSGATLQLLPAAAFTLNHAVTGAGTLAIGDGTAATAVTLATVGNGTDITVAANASLNVETGAPPETIVNETPKSIANGKTVTNNGTLTLTSGYGYFNIDGTGKTVVPGSDFLFGIGDANGTAPFSNGLEIPETANFRIRPWNEASSRTIVATGTAVVNGSITRDGGSDGVTATLQVAADTTLSGSSTFTIPVAFENAATAKMAEGATFTFTSALTVPQHVTLTGGVTLAAGAVLSGTGNLTGRVVINANAVIDATDSSVEEFLKLSGEQITLGKPLKVKVDGLTKVLNLPTTAGLTLANVQKTDDSELPTGAKFVLSSSFGADTLMLMVPPTLPAAPTESPRDAGVDKAIAAAANALASATLPFVVSEVTSISAVGTDRTSSREINAASIFANVLTLNLVEPKTNGTWTATAQVTYDFGVSQITVKKAQLDGDTAPQNYVLACAKVSNGKSEEATAAGYADGTTVSLLLDDTEAADAVALDTTTLSNKFGVTAGLGEQWFALPMEGLALGTREFTVHAKNTPQAEVTP